VFFNPNGDIHTGSGVKGAILDVNNNIVLVDPSTSAAVLGQVRAWVVTNPKAAWVQAGYFAKGAENGGVGLAPRNAYRSNGYNTTDMDFIKNTRFGKEGRFNFQLGAEVHDVFNQRPKTVQGFGGNITTGARSFVLPTSNLFLNYDFGVFPGRTITLRGKFIF